MKYCRHFGATFRWLASIVLSMVLAVPPAMARETNPANEPQTNDRGAIIFRQLCASCHGANGEGGDGYDQTIEGDLPVAQLADYVAKTMPEGDPEACAGADAQAVAEYMMEAFYSPQARLRNRPPEIELSRLTVNQFHNSVMDLMQPFLGQANVGDARGLNARYMPTRKSHEGKPVIERVDARVDFDFGEGTPDDEKFEDKAQFSVAWSGGVIPPETGTYEFILCSPNGSRLHVNGETWRDSALIDNFVAGNPEASARIKLRAGRPVPLTLVFFKYKEDTSAISLQWIPPNGVREVIPARYLVPQWLPKVLLLETSFPPDDSSIGYDRGTSVSADWDRAVTHAAMEVVDFVQHHLDRLIGYDKKVKEQEAKLTDAQRESARTERLKKFCQKFVTTAFRRPLNDSLQHNLIDRQFEVAENADQAVVRVVLLTLKSPNFLYLNHYGPDADSHDIATRLSMGFYDSLPDKELLRLANNNKLINEKVLYDQAWRLVHDPRSHLKLQGFFHHWLEMDEAVDATRDAETFPGFTPQLVTSLRRSLDLTIDEVISSEKSDYRELMQSDTLFVNSDMAGFYELQPPESTDYEPREFEPERRAGILTHPYLMMGLAYHKNTSPIHRGVFVARNLLGRTLKPPPIDVEPLSDDFDPNMTTRQRVTHQTAEVACQSCHSVINPLGFSFENFDAVGRFRDVEHDKKINVKARYVAPSGEAVQFNGVEDLADFLVNSEDAQRNFINRLFQHFARQPLTAFGTDKPDWLLERFRSSDFSIKSLLVEMAVVVAKHQSQ